MSTDLSVDAASSGMGEQGLRVSTEAVAADLVGPGGRSEEHTSELQSLRHLVCRLLLEKKKCAPLAGRSGAIRAPGRLDSGARRADDASDAGRGLSRLDRLRHISRLRAARWPERRRVAD